MDLVVTVPQRLWRDWIEEGDLPGQPATDQWAFYIGSGRPPIEAGERVYIVAHGRLRGYAPLVRVARTDYGWALVRGNGAVAVTIADPIPGFRGWRKRWWEREAEAPFPDWMTAGVPEKRQATFLISMVAHRHSRCIVGRTETAVTRTQWRQTHVQVASRYCEREGDQEGCGGGAHESAPREAGAGQRHHEDVRAGH